MLEITVIIVGPGGIGKSPLDALFKDEVARIDSYRLRPDGPRNSGDKLYAPPRLHEDVKGVLEKLGDHLETVSNANETIEWYPKSKVLLFTVRGVWQCLFLCNEGLMNEKLAKAEIYAPVLEVLLDRCDDFKAVLGTIKLIVLNPATQSLTKMQDWKELEEETRQNCKKRGDSPTSIERRARSIDVEAPAWKQLITKYGATEYVGWPFAEYCYPTENKYRAAQSSLLLQPRERLLQGKPSLRAFFKTEQGILSDIQ